MSRYIRHEVLNQPEDFVQFMMSDFLTKHGFTLVDFKGQKVFRAGGGWFEMPKFLVWSYQNGVFHMEAWARYMILPGVYSKEKDLDGFYGAVVKKMYKGDLEQLIALLHQPLNNGPQNMGQMPQGSGPIIVQGSDTTRYANVALGFGIVGLLLSWLTWVTVVLNVTAIIYARKGWTSSKKGRAIAGMVCAIIGLVITAIVFVLNFMAAAML